MRFVSAAHLAVLLVVISPLMNLGAQDVLFEGIQRARGQDVSPIFDGWARNADGTFTMYFGYLNRNSEEEIDIPIGPDNFFDLGNSDQSQPTHFLPGIARRARQMWVFGVIVPKDWPKDKRLVWTLKNRGRTNQAKGWLAPEWEVDKEGMRLGDYRNEVQLEDTPNEYRPLIDLTAGPTQTITLPAAATLTAKASLAGTDTRPLRISWIHYRGPGKVRFEPPVSPAVKGNQIMSETKATFSEPGAYRIRALANNGREFSIYDVNVTVR